MELIETKTKHFWIVTDNNFKYHQLKHNRPGLRFLDYERYTCNKIYKFSYTEEELDDYISNWIKNHSTNLITKNEIDTFSLEAFFTYLNTDDTLEYNNNIFIYSDWSNTNPLYLDGAVWYRSSHINELTIHKPENDIYLFKRQDLVPLELNSKEKNYIANKVKREVEIKLIDNFLVGSLETCLQKYGLVYENGNIYVTNDYKLARVGLQNLIKDTILKDIEQLGFIGQIYKKTCKIESGSCLIQNLKISENIINELGEK